MSDHQASESLPAPVVDSHEYDADYYTSCCSGYEEWKSSDGQKMAGIYYWALNQSGFAAGETTLDIGTGRAEMVAHAAEQGAKIALGVEYSAEAMPLAKQTLAAHGVEDRAHVMLADARRLPFADNSVDVVTMLDVVEHLAPQELSESFKEVARCLRPNGRVLIHTFPTSTIYNVTYRLQRNVLPWRRWTWPAEPRNSFELRMHVNEQTPRRLAATLRSAGLEPQTISLGKWIYTGHVPERSQKTYNRLARFRATAPLGIGNIWALARPAR